MKTKKLDLIVVAVLATVSFLSLFAAGTALDNAPLAEGWCREGKGRPYRCK